MSITSESSSADIHDMPDITTSSSSGPAPTLTLHSHSQASQGFSAAREQRNTSNTQALSTSSLSLGKLSHVNSINSSAVPTGYYPNKDPTTPPIWLNRSLTLSGDCWNQWSQFWSAEDWPVQRWTSNSISTWTTTVTDIYTYMSTSTFLSSYTTTVFNGRFPVTTYSTLALVTDFEWFTGSPTSTWTATRIVNPGYSVIEGPSVSLQSPSCILPDIVSQCQQSWDSWVDWTTRGEALSSWGPESGPPGCNPDATTMIPWSCKGPISTWESARSSFYAKKETPRCSQATISEDYCSSTRSRFLWRGEMKGYYFEDAQTTATTIDGISTDVQIWPSNRTVGGPGCTIGCGNCALQGETVELIFWPPATSLANGSYTHSPARPVTVEALGTTFTSPTVCASCHII